jgi:hypothetical protein
MCCEPADSVLASDAIQQPDSLVSRADRQGRPPRMFLQRPQLEGGDRRLPDAWTEERKPFIWTAEQGTENWARPQARMEEIKPGSTAPVGRKSAL